MVTVNARATSGLHRSGRTNDLPRAENATSPQAALRPAPTRAPVRACVVEMGMPVKVAINTVKPAPSATARRKVGCRVTSSGTSPLPLKLSTKPCARTNAKKEPARVATAAHANALGKLQVPLPKRVATPLKLSLAPLA